MEYFIAWWNVENLFDVYDSPHRPAWLQRALNSELRGWDENILNSKLDQLCKVIVAMNDGAGPDLLGVCEVENEAVFTKTHCKNQRATAQPKLPCISS